MNLSLRTAGRIAWRETRSSLTKFLFVVLAVAAGVGALSGVRGFSQSFHGMLTKEARTVMAADLTARQFAEPTAEQNATLDALRNVERTVITETFSMASTTQVDVTPLLVSIKAVDPAKYPYYGVVKLNPEMPLGSALTADSVVVGEDLLIRLRIKVGDTIRVGGQDYRIAAAVESEPDRMSGSMNIGLRLMMSREAFARTGLMQLGSRAAERILFKMNPGAPDVETLRKAIKVALPESLVADFRQSHPIITNGLDRATVFLSLVSLIALIVGAIGVGMAMHAHLQQKMDNIAVMKSIGATSNEIIRIYTLQTLMLGVLGGVAGVVLGRGVEEILPRLITKFFSVAGAMGWHIAASAQGIAVGMLTTLLFTLPPLLAIRKIRPALILRRDMPEARVGWRKRIEEGREALAVGGVILIGIGGVATWLAESPKVGGYFAGGLVTSLIALTGVAWLLLGGIRLFLKRSPWRVPSLVRQGLANLHRQGNQAQAILVALGLGVMFTLSVYLIQDSLVGQIVQTAPPGMPNVFLVGITQAQVEPLRGLLGKQDGVEGTPEFVPSVSARLISINGAKLADMKLLGMSRRFAYSRSVMWEDQIPEQTKVLEGAWWKPGTTEPVVSIAEDAAHTLNIHPGARIEMQAAGRTFGALVVAVHQTEAIRVSAANEFVFNTSTLVGFPVIYYGGVRMKAPAVAAFQRVAYEKYPTVTVVNVADALEIVQQVVDQIALVIRFLSGFAILAGAVPYT
jgi:putative ABC transport system permease protein